VVSEQLITSRRVPTGYGPRDPLTGDPLGGRTFWNATAEVQFPFPFFPRSLGVRGALFADVGQLFNPGRDVSVLNPILTRRRTSAILPTTGQRITRAEVIEQVNGDAIRASVGASLLWASPFGPLRLDYSFPVAEEDFDDIEQFNFGVSTAF